MARPANGLLHTHRDRSNKKAVLLLIVKDAYVEIVQRIASKLVVASQGGVTAVEYGLIASLVALAIIAGVTLVGTKLNGLFAYVAGKVTAP
jgi:pilus assembly protein Flp/PilA